MFPLATVAWFQALSDRLMAIPHSDMMSIASTASGVLAALVAWWQLRLLRWQLKSDFVRRRRETTLEYSLVRNDRYLDARGEIDRLFPSGRWGHRPIPQSELIQILSREPQLRQELVRLFGHWENLALACFSRMADEDFAFEMVASSVVSYTSRFREFLAMRRAENPRLYEYLIPLVDRWDTRLRRSGSKRVF